MSEHDDRTGTADDGTQNRNSSISILADASVWLSLVSLNLRSARIDVHISACTHDPRLCCKTSCAVQRRRRQAGHQNLATLKPPAFCRVWCGCVIHEARTTRHVATPEPITTRDRRQRAGTAPDVRPRGGRTHTRARCGCHHTLSWVSRPLISKHLRFDSWFSNRV